MKEEHYVKTYGVEEGFSKGIKGYFVRCDGSRTSLFFKRKDFALIKAENFVKKLHKDFVRNYPTRPEFDTKITFSFEREVEHGKT